LLFEISGIRLETRAEDTRKMSGKAACSAIIAIIVISVPATLTSGQAIRANNPVAILETSLGIITVELFADKAPITVKNFAYYVNRGFYNGTIVHRVDSVIGLGGYTETLAGKLTRPPIRNESKNGLQNLRGTLSMERFEDPHSATSKLFINIKKNQHLNSSGRKYGYTVFGKVIQGMDVVDKIAVAKTINKGLFISIPKEQIVVKSVKLIQ
jgi:peptidyl-prolyl cis-trans isomerase A (cyclophilin A)